MEPIEKAEADLMSSADRTAGQEENVLEAPRKTAPGMAEPDNGLDPDNSNFPGVEPVSGPARNPGYGLDGRPDQFWQRLLYRRWGAIHGGVYVPVPPPNPYLEHVPERDRTTPSGRQLTLINPAYMTMQVYTFNQKDSAFRGHLTNLQPLRGSPCCRRCRH